MTSTDLATLAASLPTPRTYSGRRHALRVVDPATGAVLLASKVALGSETSARRTSRTVAALWAAGARVEVVAHNEWVERDVTVRGGAPYLRTAGTVDRGRTAKALAALSRAQ